MTKSNLANHIKLVYKRTPKATKIVLLVMIAVSTVALLTLRYLYLQEQRAIDAMRQEAQIQEQENQKLESNLTDKGSVDSIENIAQEELDLVDPDSIFFQPEG